MNRILYLIVLFSFSLLLSSQNIVGTWNGTVNFAGTNLQLSVNITSDNGELKGTMDSPDQGAYGIPLSNVEFKNNQLTWIVKQINATYKGVLTEGHINGTFTQMGSSFTLNLSKGEKAALKRPQEPQPPFSYHSEELKFYNKRANIHLAGTFTYPKVGSKFPVVVLITGSGPQNRDEEIMGHKPFLILSDYLTKQGIAVLRFDDRGIGESEGNFMKSTTKDFATDAYAAVEYLKKRKEIDTQKIGLIGHSEGGSIAIQLASQFPADISFIVSMAGAGLTGKEVIRLQSKNAILATGATEVVAEQNQKVAMQLIALVEKYDHSYLVDNRRELVTPLLPITQQNNEAAIVALEGQLQNTSSYWFREFLTYDPIADLKKIVGHVLAINGAKDVQVDADSNLSVINKHLIKAKSKMIKKYPNLNHLFQTANTGSIGEYGQIEETIAPEVLKDIADWINSL